MKAATQVPLMKHRVRKKHTMHTEVSSPIVAACSLSTWVRRDVIIAELAYHVGVTNIAVAIALPIELHMIAVFLLLNSV